MLLRLLAVLLLATPALALRPAQIACLGDSNTAAGWPTPQTIRWCEYAASVCPLAVTHGRVPRPVTWYDFGIGGAVVVPPYSTFELGEARSVGADVVFLAFGTNDRVTETPAEYALNVRRACLESHHRCYVLSLPPHATFPAGPYTVDDYNAAVARVVPPNRIIDRTTGMTFVDDGVHLDDASQRLLGARVAVALRCP